LSGTISPPGAFGGQYWGGLASLRKSGILSPGLFGPELP
jgi:hypothetical protein